METRRMCPHCRAFITSSDRTCPYCNEAVAQRRIERSSGPVLGGFVPHARFATLMILIINFGLFAATLLYSMLMWGVLFSLMPHVDIAAHAGGLAGGFAVGYIAGDPRYERPASSTLWRALA